MTLPSPRFAVAVAGEQLDAVVDTGFEGFVAVPKGFLDEQGIESYVISYETADGKVVDTFGGITSVEWLGEMLDECEVIQLEKRDTLVGMELLNGTRIDLNSPDVKISRLPAGRARRKRSRQ